MLIGHGHVQVTDLAGVPAGLQHPAVDDRGAGDPGAEGEEQDVVVADATTEAPLGEPTTADVVTDGPGQTGPGVQHLTDRDVPPAHVRRDPDHTGRLVDDAGGDQPVAHDLQIRTAVDASITNPASHSGGTAP